MWKKFFHPIIDKEKLKVVCDLDLEKYLDNLGKLQAVKEGEISCYFCEDTITLENIFCFFPLSGDVKFVCDKGECKLKLSRFIDKDKISL